ncbi:MAG: phosphoglucosamine mutase [Deltaproteobacteria bacterium]|nr:phosphoglucosamine mutase [Deltaproteobacteria bacterium]
MSRKLFGTDGIRGLANQAPVDPLTALKIGQAIASIFKGKGGMRHRIVIGKDTRRSNYMLENALSAGIASMGAEAVLLGPLPTPGIAYITKAMRADAGVVLSASHNPFYDNGIKFFDHQGYKLPDEVEEQIENLLENQTHDDPPTHESIGKAFRVEDALGRYIEHVKRAFSPNKTLEGLKLVVDCGHGAAYKVGPMAFEELGAQVFPLHISPNGLNINDHCGALYPQKMAAEVKRLGAHAGLAFDGDADRLVMSDEKGQIIHGDTLIALAALPLLEEGKLKDKTIVGTVMSNLALEKFLESQGGKLLRTPVGDRYVLEAMRRGGYSLGGEQSGHLIFGKFSTTGDGILAALRILDSLIRQEKDLSELTQVLEPCPQVLENLRVPEKKPLESLVNLQKLKNKLEAKTQGSARFLIRYSGTENLLRIMIEGEDLKQVQEMALALKEEAKKELGEV